MNIVLLSGGSGKRLWPLSNDIRSKQFIKIFKKEFNKTPHGYITMLRVDIAKNLLVSSSLSIDEIATECGFETYINLYKAFISAEKCSPGEYRTKINR